MISRGVVAAVLLVVMLPGQLLASNDPLFPQQWALGLIQAEASWATATGAGTKVAVVDTGVDFSHEDLAGKSAGSFDCRNGCHPGGADDNGHGTRVASVIAAVAGNAKGMAPVAPDVKILSVKVLGADGTGSLSDVIDAIRFSADQGAGVINLSLGPEIGLLDLVFGLLGLNQGQKQQFQQAADYAASKGALVVAAAGNSGLSSYYTGLNNVFVVGASGPADEQAPYSSQGAEIYAPGGSALGSCTPQICIITATAGGGYKAVQGTSFAAPHVSGVAAQLAQTGVLTEAAAERITANADQVSAGKRVNALKALTGDGSPPAQPPGPADAVLEPVGQLIGSRPPLIQLGLPPLIILGSR